MNNVSSRTIYWAAPPNTISSPFSSESMYLYNWNSSNTNAYYQSGFTTSISNSNYNINHVSLSCRYSLVCGSSIIIFGSSCFIK